MVIRERSFPKYFEFIKPSLDFSRNIGGGGSKSSRKKKFLTRRIFQKYHSPKYKTSVGQKKLEFSQPRDKSRMKIIFGDGVGCRGMSSTRRD